MSTLVAGRVGTPPEAGRRPRPGVLLDRDGTIIVDHGYVGSPDRVELIPGSAAAIAALNAAGVPVAVVTNQAGVARGLYDLEDVATVHRHLSALLREFDATIDVFLSCPYHPEGVVDLFARSSDDRKPRPGMARAAAELLGLDLESSWIVGDSAEDVGLAEAVGAHAIYLGSKPPRSDVVCFPDLAGAVPFILARLAA